jgi:mannose-6-phosphate isomerase-like protein (cupin superfamily)
VTADGSAEEIVTCDDLDAEIARRRHVGFRLDVIFPADDPAVAVLSRGAERVRVERAGVAPPAPSGGLEPTLTFTPAPSGDDRWHVGRAGMRYRDLVPGRQGGTVIASHIAIPGGGAVPDEVHHHEVAFQLIYCAAGWVEVVYQDQGPPFLLRAGDCVLQPPTICHRVLRSSPGLEVVELGSPAVHDTRFDHDLELPTEQVDRDREFGGQRFLRHVAAEASWIAAPLDGFDARDTGIGGASAGAGEVRVLRRTSGGSGAPASGRSPAEGRTAGDELTFWFVLAGSAVLVVDDLDPLPFERAAACTLPPASRFQWRDSSPDLEVLEVTLPLRRA